MELRVQSFDKGAVLRDHEQFCNLNHTFRGEIHELGSGSKCKALLYFLQIIT